MIFKRKIYSKLLDWKNNWADERALLIQGARRIGKSTIVEEFGKNEYKSYILINFQSDLGKVEELFKTDLNDLNNFFRKLSLIYGVTLYPNKSLIIFDEVQLFPIARQSIKQLVKDGRFHYIETGSLITLKQNVKNILIPSEERSIEMYPLDFEEFLWANGKDNIVDLLKDSFDNIKPLGEAAHREIMKLYRTYLVVGGMPQAINKLLSTNDFSKVDEVKQDILNLYEADLKKTDTNNNLSTSLILNAVPSELSSHSKIFKITTLGKNARISRSLSSFQAIEDSKIVNIAYNSTDPTIGLNRTKDYGKQKIYLNDTGLLVTQIFRDSNEKIENSIYKQIIFDKISVNLGVVLENSVAQMLKASGHDLYFHTFDHYEIDFILTEGKKLIPIEVKSSSYSNHKSIDVFNKKYSDRIKTNFVIYSKDIKRVGNTTYIPFYMTMFL